jgi:presequence protease
MSTNPFVHVTTGRIASLGIELTQYSHPATGARHFHLACADGNNAFMVAFPTLPQDSSGVAHILEHTTLCGSRRYPVRDPFFMMLRRSLNTYMNAFTSTDSTAYPFATQNRKDFDNLLGVYLDAVFFPRLHPLDFAQEGWRMELSNAADGPGLEYHGVVYNEMKGAMSSPVAQLWQHLHAALLPDTVYRYNSGGDPLIIPELTHAALTDFHARHYHPSNAVFMTYGSFPAAEHQTRIEELALAHFSERRAPFVSDPQPLFTAPRTLEAVYDVEVEEDESTHIVWGWVCGDSADCDSAIEMHLLASLLLEHGASPLRHFLETTELASAPSELCGVDDSARQLVFVCGVEGSEREHAEALERGVLDVLERIAAEGLDATVLEAALDRLEMAQRDIGGDSYPFGLQLMGRMLPAAMYRRDPFPLLDLDPVIERLRVDLHDPSYVPALVRRVLLNNPHRVRLVMSPDARKAERDRAVEAARLSALSARLDAAQRVALQAEAKALAERQEAADDADLLPRVSLGDVPAPMPLLRPRAGGARGVSAYECGTNGVFRARLAYRLPALSAAETAVLPLWCDYLTELGCGREDYLTVQERRARVGSFSAYTIVRPGPSPADAMSAWLLVGAKGLQRKHVKLVETAAEIIAGVRFDERERLAELLAQSCAEAEQSVTERGHQLAVLTAARYLSPTAALDEQWDGPSAILQLKALDAADVASVAIDQLLENFAAIQAKLRTAPREVALIGEAEALGDLDRIAADLCSSGATDFAPFTLEAVGAGACDAWLTNTQVNFCAQAYRAEHESLPAAAVLAVLGRYLQDGFLHREIREKGGAYGSGAGYDADSQTFRFFSYRDPRLLDTFADFDRALDWFAGEHDARRLEEAVLGTIRALDQPRSPAGEAERAFVSYLCGRDDDSRRRFRERVLAVTHDQMRAVCASHLHSRRGLRAVLCGLGAEPELRAAGFTPARL